MRIGHGYDVHRLVEGRDLILGGVKLEHHLGLLGHSDADVLLHAVSDALLGAAGLRDKAGLDTTPQLIIYRVDQHSTGSGTRRDLEAKEDVIGISIYIPGGRIGTSYASSVSIKMKNDIFDGGADLEGTDED